jgi:hypothetical protein
LSREGDKTDERVTGAPILRSSLELQGRDPQAVGRIVITSSESLILPCYVFESFQNHEVPCGEWLAKKSTEFPVNSLVLSEIYQFWAEFDDFEIEFENSPVYFPVVGFRWGFFRLSGWTFTSVTAAIDPQRPS